MEAQNLLEWPTDDWSSLRSMLLEELYPTLPGWLRYLGTSQKRESGLVQSRKLETNLTILPTWPCCFKQQQQRFKAHTNTFSSRLLCISCTSEPRSPGWGLFIEQESQGAYCNVPHVFGQCWWQMAVPWSWSFLKAVVLTSLAHSLNDMLF